MSRNTRSKAKLESSPRQTRAQAAVVAGSSATGNSPASSLRSQRSKAADQENSKPAASSKKVQPANTKSSEAGKGKGKAAVKGDPATPAITTKAKIKPPPRAGTRSSARGKSTKKDDAEDKEDVEEKVEGKVEEGGDVETQTMELDVKVPEPDKPEVDDVKVDIEGKGEAVEQVAEDNDVYCICKGGDDGSPMIKCEGDCQNWYVAFV